MNTFDTTLAVLTALSVGGIGGYMWDKKQSHTAVAECPVVQGKVPATVYISRAGEVNCVYIRAAGIVGEPRKGSLK